MLGSKFDQKWQGERLSFSNTVPTSYQAQLVTPVTSEEVRKAIFSINGDKSPGPDGYNASFFQKN